MVAAGEQAEGLDDEVVVLALGQARDGDRTDDAGVLNDEREAAAVRGVVLFGQVVAGREGEAILQEQAANVVAGLVEAGDGGDLARDPALVVRCGAGERGVEELLVRRAKAADVSNYREIAGEGEIAEDGAELPGGVWREGRKGEGSLLADEGGDIGFERHEGDFRAWQRNPGQRVATVRILM